MKIDVLITAQNYENYSCDGDYVDTDNPSWKAKGSSHFLVEVEDFWLMYAENEDVKERFSEVIANQSNGVMKYEYVSHELLWHGIEKIDGVIQ